MMPDVTDIERWKSNRFDAIVVGSGPGGATVAKELSKQRKKVLILEWGDEKPVKGSVAQCISTALIPGKSLLFTNKMLGMVRGITTGGSSVISYATAFDPPLEMLKSYGVDISNELEDAKGELPHAPLTDELVGPLAKRIMDSARDLGYGWKKLPKLVYQDKCRPECDKCTVGCPYGAKWNARMFISEAVNNGAVLVSRAKVKKVVRDNKAAVGVEFSARGNLVKSFAPKIIISAGGIGSPVILRASGIKRAGYDFFFDPLIVVMGAVKDVKGGREFPMVAGVHIADEGYIMTDLVWPRWLYMLFTTEVLRVDRLMAHSQTLPIMIKAKDTLGGRLTDSGGVRKRLAERDKNKLESGYIRARAILKKAGARQIFKSWYIAAHPGGTVKINDVVDSNLKTEYDNLYVCDCSVIPEAWGLPPTLTLISLGKRLARHLTRTI
jgi:choline dehydrogenase-like flavoprotein